MIAPDITVVHGIPESMRAEAVSLYEEAFGPKFAVAIPDTQRRLELLAASLNLDFALAALSDGKLVGLAGYSTESGSLTDGITFTRLLKMLGLIRGLWAALIFSLYERKQDPHVLLMDGIVVAEAKRGSGIGTKLLDELNTFAKQNEFDSIRLDVIDTNLSARRMYERNGFVVTKTEHFGYLRWLLGFGASTTLVCTLGRARLLSD